MRPSIERVLLTGGVIALFVTGYFGVGALGDPSRARELGTALDRAIPFMASTVWIYLGVFPAALLPVFVVRCPRLFRRTAIAYAAVIVLSLGVFLAFPVTSTGLRADAAGLDRTRFSPWAVAVLYAADPPYNLFPSLHLSVAGLAAGSMWKASRRLGVLTLLGVALVGASICTVKQHFVADGIAGIALAAAAYGVFLRPWRPDREGSWSRAGGIAYLALLAAVYAGFWIAFLVTA